MSPNCQSPSPSDPPATTAVASGLRPAAPVTWDAAHRFVPILFFISGATALVGEVVWMRMLGLVLGNTIWAASAAVTVWMAGMSIGAGLGAYLAPRLKRHILWYGVAESGIGIFYALSPWLLGVLLAIGGHLGEDMGGSLLVGVTQRFALAVGALLPPTILMGLTLPLLVERMRGGKLAERIGLLYGLNTLGAAAGVFFAAYWSLPLLGESGSLAVASVACLLVFVGAAMIERRIPAADQPERSQRTAAGGRGFLVLAGLMGAAALAAELVWVRILVLHLGSRVYAFAILLGVYLVGLGLGSLAVRLVAPRIGNPTRALAMVQIAAATALILQIAALGHTSQILVTTASFFGFGYTFFGVQSAFLLSVAVLFLPVTVLFGASFPLAVAADPSPRSPGQHAGTVATANTIGAIVGAVAAPFLFVPLIGCQRTLILLAVVHLGIGFSLWKSRTLVAVAATVLVASTLAWRLAPPDWVIRRAAEDVDATQELLFLEEDVGATVLVKRYDTDTRPWLALELNGTNVAGSSQTLLKVQQLQGHLPLLQVADPKRVLHIGFGSGGTCWAVSRHAVERIDVVEISPRVLSASDHWFDFINRHVLADPRVHTVLNDGRNYLIATDATYDAILSDSIHPVYAGNGALYTEEYFRLCREHLNPGGVVSMWLPVYSLDQESFLRILAAFHAVFPQTAVWYDRTTVNEFTVVTGKVEGGRLSIAWDRIADENLAESLMIGGITKASDLQANLLLGPNEVRRLVAGVPPHVDDLPFVEYTAGRTLDRMKTWYDNLVLLYMARTQSSPFVDEPGPFSSAAHERDRAIEAALRAIEQRTVPGM